MQNYADLLFTDAVRAYQARAGMADTYRDIYQGRFRDDLDEKTIAFISRQSTFYIASVSASGWPYIQHRGGPPGFVKILGPDTIGFADYLGNRQFITRGNLDGDNRVSLFFMDYPNRTRLKMQGEARMLDVGDDPALARELAQEGEGPVERLVTIKIVARDWNCPKYITPRFTEAEVQAIIAPQLNSLLEENAGLKAQVAALQTATIPKST